MPQSRELRLRRRIDSLTTRLAAKERRILSLEARVRHMNYRLIELSEQLRGERAA